MRPLTDRDLEMLGDLVYMRYESLSKRFYEGGSAPIDFGGSNGSHHGKTASKLAAHGFVEQKYRGLDWGEKARPSSMQRGSKLYRATPAGRDAAEAWDNLRRSLMSPSTVKHGHTVPNTSYREATPEEQAEWRRKCHLEMPK